MTSRDTAVERGPGAITYRRLEILSATAHRELRLAPQSDYRFAAATAQVPLVAEEITEAAKHFPIVFTRDGDDIQPVALMSLSENTNVFVGRDGRFVDARLAQSSGNPLLDNAVLSAAFNDFPAFPASVADETISISVPIRVR